MVIKKICNGTLCKGKKKPLTDFSPRNNGKSVKAHCRICRNYDNKIYRENNSKQISERAQTKLQNPKSYIKYLISELKKKDKKRGRDFDIDYEYIKKLIKKEDNKCAYSGAKLIWKKDSGIHQGMIGKIDPSKGHVKGNCQLVTAPINKLKLDLSEENFIELIDIIEENFNKKIKKTKIDELSTEERENN